MGACLEPTATMNPWYNVEVRRESAYLTATTYINAWYTMRAGEGELTDEHRAAAWHLLDDHTLTAPGTPEALTAALRQIAGHGAYEKWLTGGNHAGGARAELRDGRLVVTLPNSHWYGEEGAAEISHVEIGYEDVAPVLVDLANLAAR
ncbi:hypothetical protein ABZ905_08980 [Streptomyces parvus]|uniref:hypothetical protein n=1 Tax=Streptomyces parvus TaxID=66428 RepID=UPI003400AFC3